MYLEMMSLIEFIALILINKERHKYKIILTACWVLIFAEARAKKIVNLTRVDDFKSGERR